MQLNEFILLLIFVIFLSWPEASSVSLASQGLVESSASNAKQRSSNRQGWVQVKNFKREFSMLVGHCLNICHS